jgi:hypothetical protein
MGDGGIATAAYFAWSLVSVSGVSDEAPAPRTGRAAAADLGAAPTGDESAWEAAEQQSDGGLSSRFVSDFSKIEHEALLFIGPIQPTHAQGGV